MSDDDWYKPHRPPAPPRQQKPGELLFEFHRARDHKFSRGSCATTARTASRRPFSTAGSSGTADASINRWTSRERRARWPSPGPWKSGRRSRRAERDMWISEDAVFMVPGAIGGFSDGPADSGRGDCVCGVAGDSTDPRDVSKNVMQLNPAGRVIPRSRNSALELVAAYLVFSTRVVDPTIRAVKIRRRGSCVCAVLHTRVGISRRLRLREETKMADNPSFFARHQPTTTRRRQLRSRVERGIHCAVELK